MKRRIVGDRKASSENAEHPKPSGFRKRIRPLRRCPDGKPYPDKPEQEGGQVWQPTTPSPLDHRSFSVRCLPRRALARFPLGPRRFDVSFPGGQGLGREALVSLNHPRDVSAEPRRQSLWRSFGPALLRGTMNRRSRRFRVASTLAALGPPPSRRRGGSGLGFAGASASGSSFGVAAFPLWRVWLSPCRFHLRGVKTRTSASPLQTLECLPRRLRVFALTDEVWRIRTSALPLQTLDASTSPSLRFRFGGR
jgi:hypothetical protein